MASVSGVSSSNTNSIYGNRNVFTGLASGLDTEGMIENAVSGYKTKINSLLQRQTKLSWQQEAYRAISDPLVQLSRKYASYTSSTNLLSASFFNNAVNTVTNGANASAVGATGKTSSDVQILGIKQLAARSTYNASAAGLVGAGGSDQAASITSAGQLNLEASMELSKVSGTLGLTYGSNRTIDLSFGDLETYDTVGKFVDAINTKLSQTNVSNSSGEMVAASKMVKAELKDGKITFTDNQNAGNDVTITGATGKLKDTFHVNPSDKENSLNAGDVGSDGALVDATTMVGDYLSEKTFTMTVDGKTKTITMPKFGGESGATTTANFVERLNEGVKKAFGNQVSVSLADGTDADGNTGKLLQITGQRGSTVSFNATDDVGKALGFTSGTATSYINTGATLKELEGLGFRAADDGGPETLGGIEGTLLKGVGKLTQNEKTGAWYDSQGNLTDAEGNRLGKDGRKLYGYELEINDTTFTFTRDTALESVLTSINSSSEAGVNVTFSKTTNTFQFTARETGAANQIEINAQLSGGKENLAAKLFGTVSMDSDGKVAVTDQSGRAVTGDAAAKQYTAGQDAVLSMSVNGMEYKNVTRSDNNFDVDGLSVTLKKAFGYTDSTGATLDEVQPNTEAITFTTSADAEKIVDTIKGLVEDLNKIMEAVHSGFADLPLVKSNKSTYEPLTSDDEEGMSESEIKNYEKKAKVGLLFGDRDLTTMYDELVGAISSSGSTGVLLRSMGITTDYSEGVTTLKLDENALKNTLTNDPDSVRDAFTKADGGGGLMVNINKTLERYVATTGATKGILIEKAGSGYAALSLLHNTLTEQMDTLDEQVTSWQEQMADKIDYYTRQFSRLEQLTQQMNSQSSMLMGMMGGQG